jgi:hypothetical protein
MLSDVTPGWCERVSTWTAAALSLGYAALAVPVRLSYWTALDHDIIRTLALAGLAGVCENKRFDMSAALCDM